MKTETMELRFSVEGSFVTNISREWFWLEHKPWEKVEEFLFSCMCGTEETEEQLRKHALDVVFGRAKFIGNSGKGTYALVEDDTELKFVKKIEELAKKFDETKEALDDVVRKHSNLVEYLRDNGRGYLVKDAERAFGFDDDDDDDDLSPALSSFIKQAMIEQKHDDNYGWLEPDGTFHPVDWGEHQDFARKIALEKGWITEDEVCLCGGEGDRLAERGWILLHSPARGVPVVTVDPEKRITKAQSDFLYGYYTDRGLRDEAEKYLEV